MKSQAGEGLRANNDESLTETVRALIYRALRVKEFKALSQLD
jgi:hypothetical protein